MNLFVSITSYFEVDFELVLFLLSCYHLLARFCPFLLNVLVCYLVLYSKIATMIALTYISDAVSKFMPVTGFKVTMV